MTEPVLKKTKLMEEQKGGGDCSLHGDDLKKREAVCDVNLDQLDTKLVEESNHLLNFLPEVVWLQVMEQLTDSNSNTDLVQLSNASSYFRKLLLPKRVLFHFPQVLKFIFPNLGTTERFSSPLSKILCYRSVCSSWSKTVDSLAQEKRDDFRLTTKRKYLSLFQMDHPGWLLTRNKFHSSKSVQLFLNHFENTHFENCERSPFILRDVEISFDWIERLHRPDFVNQMTFLLQKYGHHVWHLNLPYSVALSYNNLRDWLLSTVNLKSLRFGRTGIEPSPLLAATEMRQLLAEIKENPLSSLKDLHSFE